MKLIALTTLTLAMLVTCRLSAADHTKDSLDKVTENLAQKKAVLLDVRERDEWDKQHLQDARLMPLSELRRAGADPAIKERLAKEVPKGTIVYCHCAKGIRALSAGSLLEKLGYEARPLAASYDDLRAAGFAAASK